MRSLRTTEKNYETVTPRVRKNTVGKCKRGRVNVEL